LGLVFDKKLGKAVPIENNSGEKQTSSSSSDKELTFEQIQEEFLKQLKEEQKKSELGKEKEQQGKELKQDKKVFPPPPIKSQSANQLSFFDQSSNVNVQQSISPTPNINKTSFFYPDQQSDLSTPVIASDVNPFLTSKTSSPSQQTPSMIQKQIQLLQKQGQIQGRVQLEYILQLQNQVAQLQELVEQQAPQIKESVEKTLQESEENILNQIQEPVVLQQPEPIIIERTVTDSTDVKWIVSEEVRLLLFLIFLLYVCN
jgi:hypothetical protein